MRLIHPFEWLPESHWSRSFAATLALALLLMVALNIIDGPLKTTQAPMGIISFELAGDLARAQEMVASWGDAGRVYAGLSLGLDYLFLVAYPLAMALGCMLLARRLSARSERSFNVGVIAAWMIMGAAPLDALENYALIRILLGSERVWWPLVAQVSAVVKFLAIAMAVLYLLLGAIVALLPARSGRDRSTG